MSTQRVLVVEDHAPSLEALLLLIEDEGHQTARATSLREARRELENGDVGLVLADLSLPDGDGLELLDWPERTFELVVITGEGSVDSAVQALRRGAADYLLKPLDMARLRALLTQFERTRALRDEVTALRDELQDAGRFGRLIGASSAMQDVYRQIRKVAPTSATVFVTGESGTGKELIAATVHELSERRHRPMLPINCGAVSATLIESELFGHERGAFTGADRRHEGHFERAHEGTLFLDEITEMPIELQVKLLRVLETGEFLRVGGTRPIATDVRIVAASNRNPLEAVEEGKLREDLYYRLRVFPIHLPPLRDRRGDVEQLIRHFLRQISHSGGSELRITEEALAVLDAYQWPGNVRELKNVVERAAILADRRIEVADLPPEVRLNDAPGLEGDTLRVAIGTPLEEVEKRLILATLDDQEGRRKETAELLGISPKTLYNRLKAYEEEGSS